MMNMEEIFSPEEEAEPDTTPRFFKPVQRRRRPKLIKSSKLCHMLGIEPPKKSVFKSFDHSMPLASPNVQS